MILYLRGRQTKISVASDWPACSLPHHSTAVISCARPYTDGQADGGYGEPCIIAATEVAGGVQEVKKKGRCFNATLIADPQSLEVCDNGVSCFTHDLDKQVYCGSPTERRVDGTWRSGNPLVSWLSGWHALMRTGCTSASQVARACGTSRSPRRAPNLQTKTAPERPSLEDIGSAKSRVHCAPICHCWQTPFQVRHLQARINRRTSVTT